MRIGNYWEFQANDNTRGGWILVALYLILAFLCWLEVARQYRASGTASSGRVLSIQFWIALSLLVTALGVNKQLDFQTLMVQLGREAASAEGILEYKRWINWGFVALSGTVAVFIANYLWKLFRRARTSERLVLIATATLGGFIFIRAASINHVDLITRDMNRHRPLILLEMLILLLCCVVTVRNTRSS